MKVIVNKDNCIGCGRCIAITESQVFNFDDEGLASPIVNEVPSNFEELTMEAIEECPASAITEIKD